MNSRWWIVIAVGGAVVLGLVGLLFDKLSGPINTAVVTATFVAILWYAIETRKLVSGQERTAEIARYPWLEATNLKPEARKTSDWQLPLSGYHVWLPITNVGSTPAVELEVETTLRVVDSTRARPLEGAGKKVGQTLVPRDVLHLEIGRVLIEGPDTAFEISVQIAYRTIDGGRARVEMSFTYNAAQGWRNGPTRYEVRLSDGTRLP